MFDKFLHIPLEETYLAQQLLLLIFACKKYYWINRRTEIEKKSHSFKIQHDYPHEILKIFSKLLLNEIL